MQTAIYLRVSTDDQADEGYGLEVQRRRCRAMAEVKEWACIAEYCDAGISGTKDETGRPGLAQLLEAVRSRTIEAVIVLSLDRLGRKTRIVLDLVEQLTNSGVVLVSCKESLDTATPHGQFVLTMFAALAQLERDTIVARTTDGRNERAKRDGEKGGRVPFGYLRSSFGIQVDPIAASIVKRIYTMRESHSLRTIADALPSPSPRGSRWHASSVATILRNEAAYRGGQRGESAVCWPRILE
ncbi:MAG: hypothetical protein GFH27_549283n401 [Chloroflexi bacterium AL-W]|nr:hypothetical protein [Chloroflexi bacterium AL-N1]NOK64478.1 hypothetical protein [Chloroflexi bacterium AL-N10]NOK75720.1 hypothetical protein [Chloroflexi bacterium AL-N5]NOK80522.1 hypothetical protein [Chloroflexi bacterium AL-W]NOK87036.1 hypothetical protein [Chloroflexi bacterium AL-N15]